MSLPATIFGDPEKLLIDHLAAQFAPRSEVYKPTTITSDAANTTLTGNVTHLQVDLEAANADDYPVTERAQVRVTCYAAPGKRTNAKALASLAHALTYAHAGNASLAGIRPSAGRSSVVTDPDTGNLMVWFLARVNLKPIAA